MERVVGIEMGTNALRGVVLENRKGKLVLASAGTTPLGDLASIEDANTRRLAIDAKLKELVQGARLHAPVRCVGVGGTAASLRYLLVPPVPAWRLEMLAKYEIEEKGENQQSSAFDYRILDTPDVGGQYTVLIGSCSERLAEQTLEQSKQAKLGEVELDLVALALYNAYYHGHGFEHDKTDLIVNIGVEEIIVLVVRNGSLYQARVAPGGGKKFTEVLSQELLLPMEEAEELKKSDAQILFDLPVGGAGGLRSARSTLKTRLSPSLRRSLLRPGERPPGVVQASTASAANAAPEEDASAEPAPGLTDDLVASEDEADDAEAAMAPTVELKRSEVREALSKPPAEGEAAAQVTEEDRADRRRRQVSAALVREAAALCTQIENSFTACKQHYKLRDLKVDTVYLCGGGSRVKGLDEFIGRRMRVPVKPLEVFRNIDMSKLPPEAATALKAEQDTMAVSMGLALSRLCKGAFSFLLWPSALKEAKEFQARGAFLYYAAAVLLGALALLWLTPRQNTEVLSANYTKAQDAVKKAKVEAADLRNLEEREEELRRRLDRIEKNANSGHAYLRILSELKMSNRLPVNFYLTSISTNMPQVVGSEDSEEAAGPLGPNGGNKGVIKAADLAKAAGSASAKPNTDDEANQERVKVYLRGFVRGAQKDGLLKQVTGWHDPPVVGLKDRLVPNTKNPHDEANLFKDIRLVWFDKFDHPVSRWQLQEFVLEAFIEAPQTLGSEPAAAEKEKVKSDPKKAAKTAVPEKAAATEAKTGKKAG